MSPAVNYVKNKGLTLTMHTAHLQSVDEKPKRKEKRRWLLSHPNNKSMLKRIACFEARFLISAVVCFQACLNEPTSNFRPQLRQPRSRPDQASQSCPTAFCFESAIVPAHLTKFSPSPHLPSNGTKGISTRT